MPASTAAGSGGDDRVRPLTKGVSLAIIPFLVVAFAVLYPFPHDTARLFAWPIKPTIMPIILASVYIGGAYFFSGRPRPASGTRSRAVSSRSGRSPR